MSVVDTSVNSLLDRLGLFLKDDYYSLEPRVKDSAASLHQQLEAMNSFLNDCAKYDLQDENLRGVVNSVRSAVYEAEDAVDALIALSAEQRSRNSIVRSILRQTDSRDAYNTIRECADKLSRIIKDEVNSRGIQALNHQSQAIWNLSRIPTTKEETRVEEDHVIGFDEAADEVVRLLTDGPQQLEVIQIVGMVGVGKTTLARKVFKDPDVDYEFMIRAFVYVSNNYAKRDVYRNILSTFTQISEDIAMMTEQELGILLCQQLQGKQYLIVLDSVWEPEVWNSLKDAFPVNKGRRCRILITTRDARVAQSTENARIYNMDFLTVDTSRELLRWRVFGKNECPKELEEYEMNIVAKCDGLPLAIVVIAGILVNHSDRDWWRQVADSVRDYIARDSTKASEVIELTYKNLPNHLKACFLYLGVFRKDYEIPVWKLVRLWIAEGFIQHEGNSDLEAIAETYVDELVNRNLLMVGRRRSNGKIKTCRFHDTLREFCKKLAREENFFGEIMKDDPSLFSSGNGDLDKFRRVSINKLNVLDFIPSNPSSKCIRSLLCFQKEDTSVGPKEGSRILKPLKLLRVLESEPLIFTRFPDELSRLLLLRYLSLSSNISVLPSWMSDLRYMQTLIVRTTSRTLDVKTDIWKMPEFRHLHTKASTNIPSPSKKQTSLVNSNIQTLSSISPQSVTRELLVQSPNLKELSIRGKIADLFGVRGESSSLFDNLSSLAMLENLKLLNDEEEPLRFSSLGSRKIFPSQLKALTLSRTLLNWEEMTVLGKLPNLEVLKLKDNAFCGRLWETESGGFPRLKHLLIGQMDLLLWSISEDDFPQLRSLELNGCDKLQGLPLDLADILTLESVRLHCTNPQVAATARKLQVLKLQQGGSFRLSIYPPEH